MNGLNLYEKVFYHLYCFIYVVNMRTDKWRAAFSSVLVLTILIFINSIFILDLIVNFKSKIFIYSIFFAVFILNYWFFMYKKNYENLEKKYSSNNKKDKRISMLILFILLFTGIFLSIIDANLSR